MPGSQDRGSDAPAIINQEQSVESAHNFEQCGDGVWVRSLAGLVHKWNAGSEITHGESSGAEGTGSGTGQRSSALTGNRCGALANLPLEALVRKEIELLGNNDAAPSGDELASPKLSWRWKSRETRTAWKRRRWRGVR